MRARPRVIDNDQGEISVRIGAAELRNWNYQTDFERRATMVAAQEYVNGWTDRGIWLAMSSPWARAHG